MPSRRRGCRGCLLGGAVVALVAAVTLVGAVWATSDKADVGHFDTPEGEAAYLRAYDAAMARMPSPARTLDVPTSYGTVRAYYFETPATRGRTPIVLAPGRSGPASMWVENLPGLLERRPVWAIDVLGDAGRSVQRAPLDDAADEVAWMDEAFDAVGLSRMHLVGHSFGGYLAARYALAHPERIASLSLLDPAMVLAPVPPAMIAASLPASLPFLPSSWRIAMLEYVGGSPVPEGDPTADVITLAFTHYRAHLPDPSLTGLSDDEMRRLRVPTLALVAEHSPIHDAREATRRGQELLPDATVVFWPGATHSLPMESAPEVNARVLAHADAHDPR